MTLELRPLGVRCQIQCQYCYQNPIRDAGNVARDYDLDRMIETIDRTGSAFSLFGGEPLMVPVEDLERLFAYGQDRFQSNGIQTNGALIDDRHVALFKKYKVHVGISVDGPGELNDVRWAGSLEATRKTTARIEANIERLCREKIPPSLIVTLHRNNATADRLPVMHAWFKHLEALGVRSARLHVLEVEEPSIRAKYALTPQENVEALLSFDRLEREELTALRFDVFTDMRRMLLGEDNNTTCIWNACDPYTTRAVQGVEGNGQMSNCGRTNKDGIDFVKADVEGFERYVALYHVPIEDGGCQGCRFFLQCKGQCPGTAIDGDWRNRTEHCAEWMGLLEHVEGTLVAEGKRPISLRPDRAAIEARFLDAWSSGRQQYLFEALQQVETGRSAPAHAAEVATPHGDAHGDSHGDHTDRGR